MLTILRRNYNYSEAAQIFGIATEENAKSNQSYKIVSLNGQVLIKNHNLNEYSTKIELSQLNSGIYLVIATINGKVKTLRLVID